MVGRFKASSVKKLHRIQIGDVTLINRDWESIMAFGEHEYRYDVFWDGLSIGSIHYDGLLFSIWSKAENTVASIPVVTRKNRGSGMNHWYGRRFDHIRHMERACMLLASRACYNNAYASEVDAEKRSRLRRKDVEISLPMWAAKT